MEKLTKFALKRKKWKFLKISQFCCHFWVIFGSFLGHFWVIFGSFWGPWGQPKNVRKSPQLHIARS